MQRHWKSEAVFKNVKPFFLFYRTNELREDKFTLGQHLRRRSLMYSFLNIVTERLIFDSFIFFNTECACAVRHDIFLLKPQHSIFTFCCGPIRIFKAKWINWNEWSRGWGKKCLQQLQSTDINSNDATVAVFLKRNKTLDKSLIFMQFYAFFWHSQTSSKLYLFQLRFVLSCWPCFMVPSHAWKVQFSSIPSVL